ncbi:MAG TPA: hypothetical protein VMW54_07085 [Terriglobia bacterium]|nr:hypothetical protein [Terriglobia bacterium]
MGMTYLGMIVFPAREEVYKLLAVVVALYFPVAMLTWLVIDKLHKPSDERAEARRHQPGG